MTDLHRTTQLISLEPPDGGGEYYEIGVEVWWKLISKAIPPAEPAEWEVTDINVE